MEKEKTVFSRLNATLEQMPHPIKRMQRLFKDYEKK